MHTQSTSKLFLAAVRYLMILEGGYVNDKDDKGHKTKFGISDAGDGLIDGKADLNNDGIGDIAIEDISPTQAAARYWCAYWRPCNCDNLPTAYAIFLFDAAVHHGQGSAAKMLQTHLGVKVDGDIGPITCQAASNQNTPDSLAMLFAARADYYRLIVANNPVQQKFIKGWFKRLFSLHRFIYSEELQQWLH